MKGLDYSGGVPAGAAVKAANYDFVIRYLHKQTASRVAVLTAREYSDMTEHGVSVGLVYEAASSSRMLGGAAAGNSDGAWALQQAKEAGVSDPRCIYFACDFDAQPDQYAELDAYLRAAAEHVGADAVGVYGGADVVQHCLESGSARWGWQTRAWSHGRVYSGAHVLQNIGYVAVGGVTCDWNEALKPDFGQHPAPNGATPPATGGKHSVPEEEEDMEFAYRDPRDGGLYVISGQSRLHFMDPKDYNAAVKAGAKVIAVPAAQVTQKNFVKALECGRPYLIRSPKGQCRVVGNGFAVPVVPGGTFDSLKKAGVPVRQVTQKTYDAACKGGVIH